MTIKSMSQRIISSKQLLFLLRPRGYKTVFMPNSAEPEICPANNLKSPTIVNSFLLNIDEHENFSANKYENANYCFILISRENFMLSQDEH